MSIALVAGAALAALVPLGRWERARAGDEANAGIAATRSLVGTSLISIAPNRYFTSGSLVCILYSLAGRTYSVSLCFDPAGRLVEATDARAGEAVVWSVRADPSLATIRISHAVSDRLLKFMKNREAVVRAATGTRNELGRCYKAALGIDRAASKRIRSGRGAGWQLASAARAAGGLCAAGLAMDRRLKAAYGFARAPGLSDGMRSAETEQRRLVAALTRLAKRIESGASRRGAAFYREVFADSAARIRIAFNKLRGALVSVRFGPGPPLEDGE